MKPHGRLWIRYYGSLPTLVLSAPKAAWQALGQVGLEALVLIVH